MNVMITGAAGGLGRAMAVECARRGYALFLTDIDAPALAAIQKGLSRRFCVKIYADPCDLTDSAGVDALMAEIDRLSLRFDMLLNIAGIDYEGGFQRTECKCADAVSTNDEVCAAILAQGVAGSLTTNAMERVGRKTLDLAWKGRARYIPGAFNRLLFLLGKAVPASWTAALIFRRWTQTQKKWLYPTQIP